MPRQGTRVPNRGQSPYGGVAVVTIPKFCELSGYTVDAVNSKIDKAIWPQGKVWIKAPDGKRLIIVKGYELWVLNHPQV